MVNSLFPTLIVDNFFNDPNSIANYAKELEFFYPEEKNFPGRRTSCLSQINNELFLMICGNILKCYLPGASFKYTAQCRFQLIENNYNEGWVHRDPCVLTSIIYLTPESNLNSGTSLYKPKKEWYSAINSDEKSSFFEKVFENPNYMMNEDEKKSLMQNNDLFEETLNVKSVFNRMVSFESKIFHRANDYKSVDPRLTLIVFFREIHIEKNNYPLFRME